ncbi:TetR/AcrR family transcriptional regulator [Mycolicibacterium sp. CBMA 226]|uniref:TetR/AcrR family transcriptional regulator n=1 Tax=Mycolicibacterium sp. CBMA 226 TaxID=2606611 RepID=UPI001411DD55|nr:TetR/AcrR family transcriptional regulator [Mycolicibacterium sp. CBMA 226]
MPNHDPGDAASAKLVLTDPRRRLESYERIVAAATTLAALGTVDCQIRSVAATAGIAPSTLYRYFTSKDDLMLACLHRWLRDFSAISAELDSSESDCCQRVLETTRTLTASLCSSPRFTDAVIRPYLYARAEASALADTVHQQLIQIFYTALDDGHAAYLHRDVAEILADIWVTNVVAISQQRSGLDDLLQRLSLVVSSWQRKHSSAEATASPQKAIGGHDEENVA